jgi:CheY-like chemotaxis protein
VSPADATIEAPVTPDRPPHTIRVLLVDDEASLARPLSRLLRQRAFHTVAFSRPLEALAAFREAPSAFDVVVTDLHMPEVDGLVLLRPMRARRHDVPAVLVSGNHQRRASEGTEAVLLDKPF